MPEYTAFLERLRHDLGKGFSVAYQPSALHPGAIFVLVRRRGATHTLTIVVEARWIATLAVDGTRRDTRVEYKHLAVLARRFFDSSAALPQPSFLWPGTQETREALRRALDPRLKR